MLLFIGAAAAAQSALEGFFKDALARFGLAAKEVEDFLVFWLPLMASHKFVMLRCVARRGCSSVLS